jgi:hypothetical protein
MKKKINGILCDTETATRLGNISAGEYGDPAGYEEILYVTKTKKHFLYGNGGLESKYSKPAIALLTDKEAGAWKKENNIKTPKPEAVPAKTKGAVRTKNVKKSESDENKPAKAAKKKTADDSKK